jgi:mono/diheme cytochrome c family protein
MERKDAIEAATSGSRCWMSLALLVLPLTLGAAGPQDSLPDPMRGKALYERYCQRCHGAGGWGDGPQAPYQMLPPTNFHSSLSRGKPDEQLLQIIQHGVIYSPMHSWRDDLSERETEELLAYVRMLSQRGR